MCFLWFGPRDLVRNTFAVVTGGKFVRNSVAIGNRKRNACPVRFRAFNLPALTFSDQLHLTSSTPPVIEFARECGPDLVSRDYLSEIVQQRFVDFARARVDQVIGVSNEAHQPVSFTDELKLRFPEIDRVIIQYLEDRVVLARSERDLQNFADKVRENSAASPSLRFEMCNIG